MHISIERETLLLKRKRDNFLFLLLKSSVLSNLDPMNEVEPKLFDSELSQIPSRWWRIKIRSVYIGRKTYPRVPYQEKKKKSTA